MQHPSLFYEWQKAKLDIEKDRRWESNYEVPSTKDWGYKVPVKSEINVTPQQKTFWDTPEVLCESQFRYFECLEISKKSDVVVSGGDDGQERSSDGGLKTE